MPKKYAIIVTILLILLPLVAAFKAAAQTDETGLKISEIKLGGGNDPKEFVEIFNPSPTAISLSETQLEYAKTTFPGTLCGLNSWKAFANPSSSVTSKTLNGILEPGQFTVVELSLTDSTAGSLQLTSNSGSSFIRHDLVGWGADSPCFSVHPAPIPIQGQSIKRAFNADGTLQLAADSSNAVDFAAHTVPLPGDDECLRIDCFEVELPEYKEAYITELLPDPPSPEVDSEDEFIELYNPHDKELNLDNYKLFTASQSTTYQTILHNLILQPGEYMALYAKDTGLSLVNGKPGYAWLAAPDGSVIFETSWYPDSISAGQVWILTDSGWQLSSTATPGALNLISLDSEEDETTPEESCPEGKFRNSDTGRCKTIAAATAALQPCKPNQERSAETNRCRNIIRGSTALTPCKAGQVRSTETNRCRNAAASTSKACAAGYERNTETNRCRKVAAAVKSSKTDNGNTRNPINYMILGGASVLLMAYATYEYRRDITNTIARLRARLNRGEKEVLQ